MNTRHCETCGAVLVRKKRRRRNGRPNGLEQFCTCVRCQKPANAKAGPVAAATVRPPSRIERLLEIANGDESKEQTHAARRVLAKRGIDWRTER